MTLRQFLFPITLAFATVMGVPATAQAQPTLDEITTAVAQSGPLLVEAEVKQVLPSVNSPTQQAPPGPPPVMPAIPVAPALPVAPAPVAEPVTAPVVAVAQATTPASRLGGEITLAEAQGQKPSVPAPFQPNSSLFGGKGTNVRGTVDYQSTPSQTNSKASLTLAPKGQPFLVQVTGEQTTGTCPAGPGGSCEYDSRKLDVYGAYRFWTNTTEGNIGPFVRSQQNKSNGTWKSPDGLYSGEWKSDKPQTDVGIRGGFRHRLDPKSSANPWIGAGGEYDFANGSFDLHGEGSIRPGNSNNPWNLYAQGGFNTDGGYFYPEITTPNLIGDANSKLQVQLQAKGVLYAIGRENPSSQVKIGVPFTLNVSRNMAIQAGPEYVFGLDSNTRSGFGGSVKLRFGF